MGIETNIFKGQQDQSLGFQLIKRPIMAGLMMIIEGLQQNRTEEVQLHGQQNLLQENGEPHPGPYLWAVKHEVSADVINIVPYWMDLPLQYRFDFRSAMRTFKDKEVGLRLLDALVLKHFTYHVSRTSRGEGDTPEEIARLRAENEKHFQEMRENYQRGIHAILFPEGTTQTDGTVFPVKAGCYNLARVVQDDGTFQVITTVPVGVTYDHISGDEIPFLFGKLQRKHAFINIGKPFFYEPLPRRTDETEEAYTKADIQHHAHRVREQLINLNTFTVAQLAGEYVMRSVEAERREVSKQELEDILTKRVERLQRLPHTTFDDKLLDDAGRHHRIEQFWDGLERRGYIDHTGTLDFQNVLVMPDLKHYKRDNALRYCVNRVRQLAQQRDDVKSLLDSTGDNLLRKAVSHRYSTSTSG